MKHAITKHPRNRPVPGGATSAPSGRRRLGLWALAVLLCGGAVAAALVLATGTKEAPPGMVWVPGGEFLMGEEDIPDARPVHTVSVDGFWMDETEVTNEQFAAFVEQTGYQTVAERAPRPEAFPPEVRGQLKDRPELLEPGACVLAPEGCVPAEQCPGCCNWWKYRPGANWRHPEGPDSDLTGREKHPVVHIAWEDAQAYACWAGKRLPTEAEWERAARGGSRGGRYYWGDELCPGGRWMANIWQGPFPVENRAEDGFAGTAPVKSFPSNPYGLYDMAGNVWEWCADWYRPDYSAAGPHHNPQGPESSIDPDGRNEPKRVQRGGSFLCSDNYCLRYRAGARGQGVPDLGMCHAGFRCVRSAQ